jgi:hypothetical protein
MKKFLFLALSMSFGLSASNSEAANREVRLRRPNRTVYLMASIKGSVAECVIRPAPGKITINNSDGTSDSLTSLISADDLTARINAARNEVEYRNNRRDKYDLLYEAIIGDGMPLRLYESRESVRSGPASSFLLNTISGLCANLH